MNLCSNEKIIVQQIFLRGEYFLKPLYLNNNNNKRDGIN